MRGRGTEAYERFQRVVEVPMLMLSVVFLGCLVAPAIADLPDGTRTTLNFVEWMIWGAFAAELVVLLYLGPSIRRVLREHWLDAVIVAAPFLRPLRVTRLLRLVRAGSGLGRLLAAVSRVTSRRGFQAYAAVAVVVIAASGVLAWAAERKDPDANITSLTDGLWWSVVTATTVGYGDRFPVTPLGRGLAVLLMLLGIGLLGVVTANVAAVFVGQETDEELDALKAQLDRIEALLHETLGDQQRR